MFGICGKPTLKVSFMDLFADLEFLLGSMHNLTLELCDLGLNTIIRLVAIRWLCTLFEFILLAMTSGVLRKSFKEIKTLSSTSWFNLNCTSFIARGLTVKFLRIEIVAPIAILIKSSLSSMCSATCDTLIKPCGHVDGWFKFMLLISYIGIFRSGKGHCKID